MILASCITAIVALTLSASSAGAAITCTSKHCFSLLSGQGTTFYGMYGTWGRSAMEAPGASKSKPYFVNSEMWVSSMEGTHWVEAGITQGYFDPAKAVVGYHAFGAHQTTSELHNEHNFGKATQSASITDEYQISRSTKNGTWRVYFNGALFTTPKTGFWSSTRLDVGGEVLASKATASKFTMYVKGIDSAGKRVNLGTQRTSVSDGMNGSSPQNSAWTWSIK